MQEIAPNVLRGTPQYGHQQVRRGCFVPPSYIAPGAKGRHVWFLATVEVWRAEYLKLLAEAPEGEHPNVAAREATKRANEFDAELKSKLMQQPRTRRTSYREGVGHENQMAT